MLLLAIAIYLLAKASQRVRFADYLEEHLDSLYEAGEDLHVDVCASFYKVTLSAPWNYNFPTMVVYEN